MKKKLISCLAIVLLICGAIGMAHQPAGAETSHYEVATAIKSVNASPRGEIFLTGLDLDDLKHNTTIAVTLGEIGDLEINHIDYVNMTISASLPLGVTIEEGDYLLTVLSRKIEKDDDDDDDHKKGKKKKNGEINIKEKTLGYYNLTILADYHGDITAEAEARIQADTVLQTALDAEIVDRTAADGAEASAREAADNSLQANIDALGSDQAAALAAETATRIQADADLQATLDGEIVVRTAADDDEATARETADNSLQSNIDVLSSDQAAALATETAARIQGDADLQTTLDAEIAERSTADDAEANARLAADNSLQANINSLASDQAAALATETTARTQGDTDLQTTLDAEIAERIATDNSLANVASTGDFADLLNVPSGLADGDTDTHGTDVWSDGPGQVTTTVNVGIGTPNPTHELSVNGTILAKEVIVESGWADYVFRDDYKLKSLDAVEDHIKKVGYLPNMPSEKEVQENGVSLGKIQTKMLEKIEELTLYVIAQNKAIEKLTTQNEMFKERLLSLENLGARHSENDQTQNIQ